jgi:hypothetical protein
VLVAVAGMAFAPLSLAAKADGADGSRIGKSETSLKQNFVPNPKMMIRTPDAASLTPGAENRGSQRSDPAGAAAGERPGQRDRAHQDSPASAANTTTDASRTAASAAAGSVTGHDQ